MTGPIATEDEGRRISDAAAQLVTDGRSGEWLYVRLADGWPSPTGYPSRRDAWQAAGTGRDRYFGFLLVPPTGVPPREAQGWLAVQRRLSDAGWRVSDPDAAAPAMPATREGVSRLLHTPTPALTRAINEIGRTR